MKSGLLLRSLHWSAAMMSCFTMTFSTVAMGEEATRLSAQQVQNRMRDYGIGRQSMTLGQFWDKTKKQLPGQIYQQLEPYVKANRNMAMPDIVLSSAKGPDGKQIPVLTLTDSKGKTTTIQLIGEDKKAIRYNGISITRNELLNFQGALSKIEASDAKLRRENDKLRERAVALENEPTAAASAKITEMYKKDFSRFRGLPRMTPQLWASMKPFERAEFIVTQRLLWQEATKVNALFPQQKPVVPKGKGRNGAAIEQFYRVIFGEDAQAQGRVRADIPADTAAARRLRNSPFNSQNCIVAGYIGRYDRVTNDRNTNVPGCSAETAIAEYRTQATQPGGANPYAATVVAANEACSQRNQGPRQDYIACNPIIYGFPNGSPACINRQSPEYQRATHFDSPNANPTCDGMSRLTTDAIKTAMPFTGADYSNVSPRGSQIALIEADQRQTQYEATRAYLEGVLRHKDSALATAFAAVAPAPGQPLPTTATWTSALDEELIRIQTQFEEQIQTAITSCERDLAANAGYRHEPNQRLACDQLHRRWLFTERFVERFRRLACIDGSRYVGAFENDETSWVNGESTDRTRFNKKSLNADGTVTGGSAADAQGLCECPAAQATAVEAAAGGAATGGATNTAPRRVKFNQTCGNPPITPPNPPQPPPTQPENPPSCGAHADPAPTTPPGGPITHCICRTNPTAPPTPIGQPLLNCNPPTVVQPPAGACVHVAVEGINPDTCRCNRNDEPPRRKKDGTYTCKKDNSLLIAGGVIAALLGGACIFGLICGGDDDKPPQNPTCDGAGKIGGIPVVCPVDRPALNAATCVCGPVVEDPCPALFTRVAGQCVCDTAAAAATCNNLQTLNATTCACVDNPVVLCPDQVTRIPPGSTQQAACPKCAAPNDNIYITHGQICPEGGAGDNCSGDDCNVGAPTRVRTGQ